jgi:hypothetical protein
MRRFRASFTIDAIERSASGGCARRSADSLWWRLFLGIQFRGIQFRGIHVLGFRRGLLKAA